MPFFEKKPVIIAGRSAFLTELSDSLLRFTVRIDDLTVVQQLKSGINKAQYKLYIYGDKAGCLFVFPWVWTHTLGTCPKEKPMLSPPTS